MNIINNNIKLVPPADLHETNNEYPSKPNEIIFVLTTRCNQNCTFCCEPPSQPDISYEDAIQWLSIIHNLQIPWVDFSGGEPLLHPKTPELLEYACLKGLRCTLSTNGIILANYLDLVWKNVSQWNISLHGEAEAHDHIVGHIGSFNKVISAVSSITSRGGNVHITYVVTPSNLDSVGAITKHLSDIGVNKLCFNYVFRRGKGRNASFHDTQSWIMLHDSVQETTKHLQLAQMVVYHNLNLDGQCILVRSTGEVWAVPMSNENDYELICQMTNCDELNDSYPYIENHRKFTWPRLGPLQSSCLGYDMSPGEGWRE